METTLHFRQTTLMNTHYLWSTFNSLISLGEKYDQKIEYWSMHTVSDVYYDIWITVPNEFIAELVEFYILANLPELVKIEP